MVTSRQEANNFLPRDCPNSGPLSLQQRDDDSSNATIRLGRQDLQPEPVRTSSHDNDLVRPSKQEWLVAHRAQKALNNQRSDSRNGAQPRACACYTEGEMDTKQKHRPGNGHHHESALAACDVYDMLSA